MKLTVLDTETSGLDHDKHEILEIALISYVLDRGGNRYVLRKYEEKVQPQNIHLASERALEINGYTDEGWKDAKPASEVMEEVKRHIEDSDILLGQNLIFDLRFIKEICQRSDIEPPQFPAYIDTKSIADELVKANWLERSGMDYLVEHYKVEVEGRAHTALVDCERTMLVWDKLVKETGEDYTLFTFDEPYEPWRKKRKNK